LVAYQITSLSRVQGVKRTNALPLYLYARSYFNATTAFLSYSDCFASAFHFPSLLRLVGTIMLFFPFQDVFLFDKNPMGVTN
jgi:hypothetical protein